MRDSMHVVNLVYARPVLPMSGFGYLVPASEPEHILGCVFDSCVFPGQAWHRLAAPSTHLEPERTGH